MLNLQNRKAKLKQEHSQLRTELEYFEHYYKASNYRPLEAKALYRLKADQVLKLLVEYQKQIKNSKLTLFYKLYNLFVYRIYHFSIYKEATDKVVSFLQNLYFHQKLSELEQLIKKIDQELEHFNFKQVFEHAPKTLLKEHYRCHPQIINFCNQKF